MVYNYRESGYGRCDYLIVTKKGKEEGRLPDGIVILTGQLYADPEFKAWLSTAEEKGYHVFVAKHCENERELTHISKMDLLIVSASSLLKQICLNMAILIMTSEVEAGSDEKMPPPSRKH